MFDMYQPKAYKACLPFFKHRAKVEYVASLSNVVGLSYDRSRKPIRLIEEHDLFHQTELVAKETHLRSNAFSVYLKHFFRGKGFLAPVGAYFKIGGMLLVNVVKDDFNQTDQCGNFSTSGSYLDFGITMKLGHQHMLWDRVVLDLGGEFGLPVRSYHLLAVRGLELNWNSDCTLRDYQQESEFWVNKRLLTMYLFNLTAGVSVLLF